ncbi:thioesterase family protein [Nocardioides sp.]|uniref:acyl-CoA thioesterase n=1 Tax=Nocardioides sp. TaxID=35761 RepID=UPI00263428E2|nr:thioesterase family protein [Nocardioides sp.]
MHHTYTCDVRWGDMDALGHVNNVVFADYLQEARIDLLRAQGAGAPTDTLTEAMLVVSQHVEYSAPLHYDGKPVLIDVWTADVKAATFTLAYEIYRESDDGRTVYATAQSTHTLFSFVDQRPRRLNETEREQLGLYLEPTPVARVRFGAPAPSDAAHYPVQVRFSDIDAYGHSNNVIYLEYFQEARIAVMGRELAKLAEDQETVTFPAMVVAAQHLEYKRPMVLRSEPYDAWTWVARWGTTSMVLEAQICDTDGTVVARGQFVMVFVDPETETAIQPAPEFRALLEREITAV